MGLRRRVRHARQPDRAAAVWLALGTALGMGCNALDARDSGASSKRIIPTDTRAVRSALRAPPPIQGGTLSVDPRGAFAVASDPDRDRISIVDLQSQRVAQVDLSFGDRPGRVAIDRQDQAHVVLRGSGEVLTLALASAEVLARRAVCGTPRGIDYDAGDDALVVACAEGKLVSLAAFPDEADPLRVLDETLPEDLRDVIVRPDGSLRVSRFKRAEVLSLDPAGEEVARARPLETSVQKHVFEPDTGGSRVEDISFAPGIAWRMAAVVDGSAASSVASAEAADEGVVVVHQGAMNEEVDIDSTDPETVAPGQEGSSSYGGGAFSCEGIVSTAVTWITPGQPQRSALIPGAVLPVDVAVSRPRGMIAIAQAGTHDPETPEPFVVHREDGGDSFATGATAPPPFGGLGNVQLMPLEALAQTAGMGNCVFGDSREVEGQVTAVAFAPGGELLVQSREPAKLVVFRFDSHDLGPVAEISLEGASVEDTGHELFHRDTGAGIACASCHAEGGDDGHTWRFSGLGKRRTQAMHVGLEGTAPFHWDGDMANLGVLMTEVFVGRMGGVHQSPERLDALSDWLFSLRPPAPIVDPASDAAQRGKVLFESEAVGCASCHAGETLTDNRAHHVGTTDPGRALQVPSLYGIGYRAPFLHDGCAGTLEERFDPDCGGGDEHGRTSHLRDNQIEDLIAYLKSL